MTKPIFCDKNGVWKEEVKKRLERMQDVTLLALGETRGNVLAYVNSRRDLDIISVHTRYMKDKSKGIGLKIKVCKKPQ